MTFTIDLPVWAMALAIVFVVAWLIQFILQLVVWLRPLRHTHKLSRKEGITVEVGASQPGVSILVYSRNAAEELARNLPEYLSQDYPNFEVIVLDDDSCDDTADVLTMTEQRYENFFHTRIDARTRAMSHRKLAVLLGAKASHYDILLMTHAECRPDSHQWISEMVRSFSNPGTEVVLGPVVYERHHSFLSRFCQFDLFQRLLLMFGLTLSVRPFAGWGQNLAFRKSTFYANDSRGFQSHLKIQPGEDDLFVGEVAHGDNVAVSSVASAVVSDQSNPTFLNWSIDRLNRGFTSRMYAWAPSIVKGLDSITRYLTVLPGLVLVAYAFYLAVVVTVANPVSAWTLFGVVLALLLIRMALMIYTFVASAHALRQRAFISWPLLLDLYMPLVDIWFRIKAITRKKRFGVSHIGLR